MKTKTNLWLGLILPGKFGYDLVTPFLGHEVCLSFQEAENALQKVFNISLALHHMPRNWTWSEGLGKKSSEDLHHET
jgi:hypothetical protein